jgi:hypothetical protein
MIQPEKYRQSPVARYDEFSGRFVLVFFILNVARTGVHFCRIIAHCNHVFQRLGKPGNISQKHFGSFNLKNIEMQLP